MRPKKQIMKTAQRNERNLHVERLDGGGGKERHEKGS